MGIELLRQLKRTVLGGMDGQCNLGFQPQKLAVAFCTTTMVAGRKKFGRHDVLGGWLVLHVVLAAY